MSVRVLIVDDSAMMRSFLREVLSSDPDIEVVGVASDPYSARQKIKLLDPAVITLDIEMPGMDGLTFLEHLMRLRPTPVVMVSSLTQWGAAATLRALEIGAVDFIAKPSSGFENDWPEFRSGITAKVKMAARALVPFEMPEKNRLPLSDETLAHDKIVALGGSTGSVSVLQYIIGSMPADGPGIVVAIHMPAQFTKQFAARLDGICAMTVREATDGMNVEDGHAYVAPGDKHLMIKRSKSGYVCRLENGPRINGHVPSVDVLFESVANAAGSQAVGIILSGMGRDGAAGLRAMRDAGALTACQNEASCLIYGMPGSAVAAGAVCDEIPLHEIPGYICSNAMRHSTVEKDAL